MKKHKPAHSKSLAILLSVSLLAGIVLPTVLSEDKALAVSSNMTVYASQDKYVDESEQGAYDYWSTGSDSLLYVGYQPDYVYGVEKAVFRFDLSRVPGPITSAVLRVYPYNIAGTCNVDVIGSYDDAWTETDKIIPADKNGTPPVTILQNQPTHKEGSIDDSANDFDVTAFVESQRTGDQNATLVLSPTDQTSTNEFAMFASEHYDQRYQPQLIITYTAPSASLTSGTLTESNVNGATVNLALDVATFTNSSLNTSNFSSDNSLFTVSAVSYTDSRHCSLTLAYAGTDFDTNQSIGITIAGSVLSSGKDIPTTNKLSVTANNDAESLSLSGSATEGAENGAIITAAISGGQFAGTITPADWTVSNLPDGVTKGAVTRVDNTHVRIVLSGNAAKDYDTNITNVSVSCTSAEYIDSTGGGSLSANSGFTLTAVNDTESLAIHDDGSILEGAENGEIITATISGGQFADTLTPGNWSFFNLPAGIAPGTITRIDDTHVEIALDGNSEIYYTTDITDVTVSCTASEYRDSTGGGALTANSGVTLTAVILKDVILSSSSTLAENTVNGSTVNLTLAGVTFAVTTPDMANYTVLGAPFTVSGATYVDDTHVNLTLGYTGDDFDQDRPFSIAVAGAELSDGAGFTSNTINVVADNDAESLTVIGSIINEGQEYGKFINVFLDRGTFVRNLTSSHWMVTGLPSGVSVGNITRRGDASVSIQLVGNAIVDYDRDITGVYVSCTADQYNDHTGEGNLNAMGNVTFKAVNDPETLSIRDDGSITEGAENGELITVEISGGMFASSITPSNWTVTGLPSGVSAGAVTRVDSHRVTIALSGNSTNDYDADITNIAVSCTTSEYNDNSGGASLTATSGVTFKAINDPESISISDDGLITEGAEGGEILTAALAGGQYASSLTPANWTVSNLPDGVAMGTVTRMDDTHVQIALSGNSTKDYDTDITNVTVSCTASEYSDSTGGGALSDNSGVKLTAVNDPESIAISDDGNIAECAENGEIITVTLSGGRFAGTLNSSNWTISGLPDGVTKGTVTRVDNTHVTIALIGNAMTDYDSDITNVSVSCAPAEYGDSDGGSDLVGTGVTLRAENNAEALWVTDDSLITEGHEDGEVLTVTISGGQFADTLTPGNWALSNLPDGVVKGTLTRVDDNTVTVTLSGNSTSDYDADITNVSISCTADEYTDSTGDGTLLATGMTFTAIVEPELVLTAPVLPEESNIYGATLNLRIKGMTFADAALDEVNFTVSAPFAISDVQYVDSTHCTLTLSNGGTDFDSTRHLDITVAGSELSTGLEATSNPIDIAATDDAESLAVQSDGNITEGSENGEILTAVITGGTFADTLTPANWTVSNLPDGVTVGSVTRVDAAHVSIMLSGNARWDYDANLDIAVACTADEYSDSTGGGSLTASGVTFTCVNDPESISIHDDGNITEGAENGEIITVTLTGGQFAASLNTASWTVSNLPSGVTAGSITRTDNHTVTIALSGNTSVDYDADITNVSVTCAADQYVSGADALTASSGVLLKAVIEATPTPSATPTPIPSASPTPTAVPTATPVLTATPVPTATSVPTATPTATPAPAATQTPKATPVPTKTPAATATPAPTKAPVPTATTAPDATTAPSETSTDETTASISAPASSDASNPTTQQTETAGPSKTSLDHGNASGSKNSTDTNGSLWIWILIAIAGISAAVIVVWFVRKGHKNRK